MADIYRSPLQTSIHKRPTLPVDVLPNLLLTKLVSVTPAPFFLKDFPNPPMRARDLPRVDPIPNTLLFFPVAGVAGSVARLPQYTEARRRPMLQVDVAPNLLGNLLTSGVQPAPFFNYDWPIVQRRDASGAQQFDAVAYQPPIRAPFIPIDIGNPTRRTMLQVDAPPNLLAKAVGGASLQGAASDTTTAAGALSTGIPLAGAATDTTSATGSLAAGAALAGAASDTTSAAGALTNYATVVLSGTQVSGAGTLYDPSFAWPNSPAVGDTIYYDNTYLTINPDGSMNAYNNTFSAFIWFNDGTGPQSAIVSFTPGIAGAATDTTTASGSLVPSFSGQATDTTSGAGALTTAIRLLASASDVTTAVGGLVGTAAALQGAATDVTTAFGTLMGLGATASDTTSASGSLTTGIKLGGAASDVTTAIGSLNSSAAALVGAATDVTSAAGALTTAILAAGSALDTTTAAGALTTLIQLAGAAIDVTSAAGALFSTGASLAGAGIDTTLAAGALTTMTTLVANAIDATSALGQLTTQINLSGAAADTSAASGGLIIGLAPTGGVQGYVVRRRYLRPFRVSSVTTQRFDPLEPGEAMPLTFDFSVDLPPGVILTNIRSVTYQTVAGIDANPQAIANGNYGIDVSQVMVIVPVVVANNGCDYLITVKAATSNPYIVLVLDAVLPVRS